MVEDTYTCYAIKNNNNGLVYIGITYDVDKRIRAHLVSLKKNTHTNKKLQEDYNNEVLIFTYHILETNIQKKDKFNKEWFYIRKYKTHLKEFGYNFNDIRVRKLIRPKLDIRNGLDWPIIPTQ